MKQLLTLMLLAGSTAAMAQSDAKIFHGQRIKAVPQAFTLDGKAIIYLETDNNSDEDTKYTILDENMQEVRSFTLIKKEKKFKRVTETRIENTTDEWETTTKEYTDYGEAEYTELMDWRTTYADNGNFYLSQTLYNDDANLEYMLPLFEGQNRAYEEDLNQDGIIDRKVTEYSDEIVGYSIASENGTIIQNVRFGDGITAPYSSLEPEIFLFGDKCYLAFNCYQTINENESQKVTLVYSIDRKTSAIQQVAMHRGAYVSPTIADRSETIRVQLDDAAAREVQVVNAAGKTVVRIPVKAGQQEVNIPARHLSRGVNVVNVVGSKDNSSTKVIVK